MNKEIEAQIDDLNKTIKLKNEAQKEQARLRTERANLGSEIGDLKAELIKLEQDRNSMKGMDVPKLKKISGLIAQARVNIQSLEEATVLLDNAIKSSWDEFSDYRTTEQSIRDFIASLCLEENEEEFKKLMLQLLPYWGLASHNYGIMFNNSTHFSNWISGKFYDSFGAKIKEDNGQYLDKILAK